MRIYMLLCVAILWSTERKSYATFLASDTLSPEFLVRQHVTLERQKRYLLYPDGDPARIQMIIGLGLPLDLEDETVTIGYVIKILYHIPQVAEDYSTHAFNSASIIRAFGSGQNTVVVEGNQTKETEMMADVLRNSEINVTNNTRNKYVDNYINEVKYRNIDDTKNDKENTDGEKSGKEIRTDPIIEDYLVPENKFKHKDKQNVKYKNDDENHLVEGGEYREELKNKDEKQAEANELGKKKRDNREKNANLVITNEKYTDDLPSNGQYGVYSEGETIVDKENNDVYEVTMSQRDEEIKGEWRDDKELISSPKTTRWGLYKIFENMLEQKGYEGRSCMLRTICEAAETPFTHKNGILGELVHILLTPSTTQEALSHSTDKDYHTAEKRGLMENIDCQEMYPDCEESILELFSEIGMDYLMQ